MNSRKPDDVGKTRGANGGRPTTKGSRGVDRLLLRYVQRDVRKAEEEDTWRGRAACRERTTDRKQWKIKATKKFQQYKN